ncbi:MAG: hypothetical protein JW969_19340 [Spirochaetales bacterium]|nr:hypothetical protein [Spirochaetales bacterium]
MKIFWKSGAVWESIPDSKRLLTAKGKLFCRVNSVFDYSHGAGQVIRIEKNYYYQEGIYKRFFDEDMINDFFSDWDIQSVKNHEIECHLMTKNVFEIICSKRG